MTQFYIQTDHPVALDSPDHIVPVGTKRDNYYNLHFNAKLYGKVKKHPVSLLDLGCAGGKFVTTIIGDRHIAVGIEGSDYSKVHNRPHWDTCPKLFTADAAKPFTVHTGDGLPYKFDCVTAWEFFEHIQEDDIPGVMENIDHHLVDDGFVVCSISTQGCIRGGLEHHQTRQPREWWVETFGKFGYHPNQELYEYFNGTWVRQGAVKLVLRRICHN